MEVKAAMRIYDCLHYAYLKPAIHFMHLMCSLIDQKDADIEVTPYGTITMSRMVEESSEGSCATCVCIF